MTSISIKPWKQGRFVVGPFTAHWTHIGPDQDEYEGTPQGWRTEILFKDEDDARALYEKIKPAAIQALQYTHGRKKTPNALKTKLAKLAKDDDALFNKLFPEVNDSETGEPEGRRLRISTSKGDNAVRPKVYDRTNKELPAKTRARRGDLLSAIFVLQGYAKGTVYGVKASLEAVQIIEQSDGRPSDHASAFDTFDDDGDGGGEEVPFDADGGEEEVEAKWE